MLTKKDFKAVTEIINYHFEDLDGAKAVAYDLADYFATQDPQFDRDKFLTACGIGQ